MEQCDETLDRSTDASGRTSRGVEQAYATRGQRESVCKVLICETVVFLGKWRNRYAAWPLLGRL